jgi:hypothetical protein
MTNHNTYLEITNDYDNKAIFKFNNGLAALLCSKCSKIIKIGQNFNEHELNALKGISNLPQQFCDSCSNKEITNIETELNNLIIPKNDYNDYFKFLKVFKFKKLNNIIYSPLLNVNIPETKTNNVSDIKQQKRLFITKFDDDNNIYFNLDILNITDFDNNSFDNTNDNNNNLDMTNDNDLNKTNLSHFIQNYDKDKLKLLIFFLKRYTFLHRKDIVSYFLFNNLDNTDLDNNFDTTNDNNNKQDIRHDK